MTGLLLRAVPEVGCVMSLGDHPNGLVAVGSDQVDGEPVVSLVVLPKYQAPQDLIAAVRGTGHAAVMSIDPESEENYPIAAADAAGACADALTCQVLLGQTAAVLAASTGEMYAALTGRGSGRPGSLPTIVQQAQLLQALADAIKAHNDAGTGRWAR